jgi:hypothetical protein
MSNFSCIKVFTYEVLVNKSYLSLYSFKKFKKESQKTNNPIKSKEFSFFSKTNKNYLFSKNILVNNNSTKYPFFLKNIPDAITNSLQEQSLTEFEGNTNIESLSSTSTNSRNTLLVNKLLLLYEEYYTYSARKNIDTFISKKPNNLYSRLKSNIYNEFPKLLLDSTQIMIKYLNNKIEITGPTRKIFNNLNDDDEIIIKINYNNDNAKIIVMGDQHGSFHSFFRIIIRLMLDGIISENYKLHPDYKIIFLGDIIDRGNYGVEIMYIILKLFTANNNENELNVILNRGNHEEFNTFKRYGFLKEFKRKIFNYSNNNKKKENKINSLLNFYKYCSSAIILTQNDTKYWLCHGGFPLTLTPSSGEILNLNNGNNVYINNNMQLGEKGEKVSEIRWNDFTNRKKYSNSPRGQHIYNIGTNILNSFLQTYHINFIIRGHTDNENNAMILRRGSIKNIQWHYINKKSNKKLLGKSNLIKYSRLNKSTKEIATIYPQNFNTDIKDKKGELDVPLYPVLTISNCCDIDRDLYNDSYIIIEKEVEEIEEVEEVEEVEEESISAFAVFSRFISICTVNTSNIASSPSPLSQ